MALENYRITEFQEKTQVDNGDYVLIDSATDGTHKYQLSRIPAQASAEVAAAVAAEETAREAADAAEVTARNAAIGAAISDEVTARNAAIAANVDDTLAVSGKAADAKKTGDEIADVKSDLTDLQAEVEAIVPGLSDDAKAALLACFAHVAWSGNDGQDYYDALEDALYAQSSQLRAVFTQGTEKYYPFDNLNSLKENLVVTYTDGEGQSSVVTNYTLSGTLSVGTSRIAVGYNGLTAYFTVTVSTVQMFNGAAIGKNYDINGNPFCSAGNTITARARFDVPIKNRAYTIAIADSTKYNLAGYNLANNVLTDFEAYSGQGTVIMEGYLMSENVTPSWSESITVTGNYVWVSFKKLDGTDFTTAEIENAYGTIYTVS